ncbi:hypothetical protein SUNI508_12550 [Seiridium unicorne]|uniref:Histone H2B n=1 Tax=Seiridium unicorne TaxID=138068 RepID=A0ABR2VH68_9PEZI
MAQGAVKPKGFSTKVAKPSTGKTKKGARVAKPKKATSADKITKKYSAGLVHKTEKLLGERAGHLEMVGKGRDRSGAKKEAGAQKGGICVIVIHEAYSAGGIFSSCCGSYAVGLYAMLVCLALRAEKQGVLKHEMEFDFSQQ